eukprot:m.297845 g.297845  ORF g.297845 m.297845 type:complete len:690 (-) comp16404_c0_seq4:67-2136(-)
MAGAGTKDESKPLLPASNEFVGDAGTTRASLKVRWLVLVLSCLLMIGNYYCYDNPEALAEQLKRLFSDSKYASRWQTWYGMLYSVYSFPNIVLPFFGGFLVDRLGVLRMLVVFNVTLCAGQLLFALGGSLKSIPVMLAGRVLFGFGGENLTVAQSALIAVWFKNKELAFSLGLCLSLSRLGSVANNFISPLLWKHGQTSLWVGAIICGASLACTLVLIPIDKLAEAKLKRDNPAAAKIQVEEEEISLTDVRYFKLPFWLLTFSCFVVYGTVIPFNSIAGQFFQHRNYINTDASQPWTSKPGATNRTYIIPDDCKNLAADPRKSGICNKTDTFYLGPSYVHATFEKNGNVTGEVVKATCDGKDTVMSPHNASIMAYCNTTDAKWVILKNSTGKCMPKNKTSCNVEDHRMLMYLKIANNKNHNQKNSLPTKTNSTSSAECKGERYCTSNGTGCLNGQPVDIICNEEGFLEYQGDKYCSDILYKEHDYCDWFQKAVLKAATVVSIPYIICGALSPFLGFYIDFFGQRAIMATLAPLALLGVHLSLALTHVPPIGPMAAQGVAYSVFAAALWPSVPYVVDEAYVGTAYGMITAIQNGGLALFPIIIGTILDPCNYDPPTVPKHIMTVEAHSDCVKSLDNYMYSEFFFAGLAGVGALMGLWLNIDDCTKRGNQLNKAHYESTDLNKDDETAGIN